MDAFEKRKKDILEKIDKSAKGSWDLRIVKLCEKINSFSDYYTTSSCSGKCVVMEEKTGKDGSYYLWESHEEISFDELKFILNEIVQRTRDSVLSTNYKVQNTLLKFKFQSSVIFVVCRDVKFAEELFELVREAGFKESGIHITKKLIGIEIRSGEKLEFPLLDSGKILVSDEFVEVLVKEVNRKLKICWKKLDKLCLVLSTKY